ncbi:MAG TPA: adenylate/guanylate cyclase domain-containing protein [Peptococcaceae bacterium]|nr:adenylate/guanylate cyclase domain-containing protein [Peptococcaceae bacterium]
MKQRLRPCLLFLRKITGCLLCFALALLLSRVDFFTQGWEDLLLSIRFFGKGAVHYREPVIIRIDEASIRALGAWPWPRSLYAQALQKLAREKPSVVGLDLFFREPDPRNDPLLAKALKETEIPVVLGTELDLELEKTFWNHRWRENGEKPSLFPSTNKGYLNLIQDRDGVIRKWPFPEIVTESAFTERIYQLATGENPPAIRRGVVSFIGGLEAFPSISFSQLLTENYPADFFHEKVVLIGVTKRNMDRHMTALPALGAVPGVYIHAYLLRNLLEKSWLKPVPGWLTFLSLLGLSCCWAAFLRNRTGFFLFLATVGTSITVLISGVIAGFAGYIFPIPAILGLLFVEPAFLLAQSYRREAEERRRIKRLFSKYISPEILKEILQKRNEINFNGERRFVAVLFADIRDFTRYTEEQEPEQVVSQINQVLGRMTEIILSYGGLVDKFLGDGLMAVFGFPVWEDRMLERVFAACNEMVNARATLGGDKFAIGIGLSWGIVIAGSVGNQERMEYTFMGAPVNLAARLEKLAGPGEIVFSFDPERECRLPAGLYTLEEVQIKGFRKPTLIGRIKRMEGKR